MSTPVLHLVAGPNGAGKTTLVERLQATSAADATAPLRLPFVNADLIAAERWPGAEAVHAYDASAAAAAQRARLMANQDSFITETVFSHRSKVDLVAHAVTLGYLVHLHVILIAEDVAVRRVAYRVERGGHDVPEAKVRQRYARSWDLIVEARSIADRATFYDNSRARAAFHVVAQYEQGRLVGMPSWPSWTPDVLVD